MSCLCVDRSPVRGAARARRRLYEGFLGIQQGRCVDRIGLVPDDRSMVLGSVERIADFINRAAEQRGTTFFGTRWYNGLQTRVAASAQTRKRRGICRVGCEVGGPEGDSRQAVDAADQPQRLPDTILFWTRW
jgi:hypothetical protein